MIKHYADKMKKNKKLKSLVMGLQQMNSETKRKMLDYYYTGLIVMQNQIDCMYYMAQLRNDRGPKDAAYGLLIEKERNDITRFTLNIKKATDFIFKGTKST